MDGEKRSGEDPMNRPPKSVALKRLRRASKALLEFKREQGDGRTVKFIGDHLFKFIHDPALNRIEVPARELMAGFAPKLADNPAFEKWYRTTKIDIEDTFGKAFPYAQEFANIHYSPGAHDGDMPDSKLEDAYMTRSDVGLRLPRIPD